MKILWLKLSLVSLTCSCAFAASKPAFSIVAETTDGPPPVTVTATGHRIFDFVDSLVNTKAQFQQLDNRAFTASLTYLGVPNAIQVNGNRDGTRVSVNLTPTNFNRTFEGPTRSDVERQLEDFLKGDGGSAIADFLKAIAESSPIAITDGNPTSGTALAASSTFESQGFTSSEEMQQADASESGAAAPAKSKFGGIAVGMNFGVFDAAGFEGVVYDISGTLLDFGGERVRMVVPINFNFVQLDGGGDIGGAGISFCFPIRLKLMGRDQPWNWRVTPLAGASLRGSVDLGGLSPLWQVGFVNTVDYRINKKLVVSAVNQITMHRSVKIAYDDLNFDPNVDQQILKNGVRFSTPFSRRVIADAFVVHTNFLKDAAVDQFWSVGANFSFRVAQKWSLVLGGNYDTGDNFKAYSLGLTSAWRW
jgi:hypothetical protein